MPLKLLFACLVAALALACGGSSSDSSSSGTASGPKLAWDQFAPGADELRLYSYVLYVDGAPTVLTGAACGTLAAETLSAACAAPLPALAPGQHTLEMATRITRDGVVLESARSAPITYAAGSNGLASGTAGATASGAGLWETTASVTGAAEGEPGFVVETVVTGLDRPSALVELPGGRLLIAERGGVLRIFESGALQAEPAGQLAEADPADNARVSFAVAPDFKTSGHVYVSYGVADHRGTRTGRIVRLREAGGFVGEAAVVVDALPAALTAPWVAIGADAALYVGTSSADAGESAAAGKYGGKVLRFRLDGTTPTDNPLPASPVYSTGYRDMAGCAWEPESGGLWVADADEAGSVLARVSAGARAVRGAELGPVGPGRMTFIPADAAGVPAAWRGSLLIAAPEQHCLLRVSGLSASHETPAIERLLEGQFGRITLVTLASDGIYFTAEKAGGTAHAPDGDSIYRLRALPAPSAGR